MTYFPAPIATDQFLGAFERTSAAFATAARDLGIVPVAACAPWTSGDLIVHLSQVYGMVKTAIVTRATEPVRFTSEPEAPTAEDSISDLVTWFETQRTALLHALSTTDPDLSLWTWGEPHTAAFYFRRMAHETAIHLADLQPTVDFSLLGVSRLIFCDGIDEYFDVVLPRAIQRRSTSLPSGSLHLHCTDGDGEWLLTVDSGVLAASHEHAKAAVAWRGSAADLLLACWGRMRSTVEVLGEPEISHQWVTIAP